MTETTTNNKMNASNKIMVFLFVAIIALLPFGRLAELPILALAVWGLVVCFLHFKETLNAAWFKPYTWVFILFFALTFISALDSFWPEKSRLISAGLWRFYFMGIALLCQSQSKLIAQSILKWVTLVLMFWVFDALIQAVLGHNLLGLSSYPGRLTGVFGQNVKLGPLLALMLPLILIQSHHFTQWLRWLSVVLVLAVILLSGTRSAWLMAAFVMVLFWWHHVKGRRFLLLAKALGLAAVGMFVLYFVSTNFQQRVERTLNIFDGNVSAIDYALADRLPIWQTAINMYQEHPVNGVGARAFRKAYQEFAGQDDVWVAQQGMGLHAHHWVLEIMAETGTIGMALFLLLLFIVITYARKHFSSNSVWPYAVALMAALLPVVSLFSLFSSFWSICLWWLLVMMFLGVKNE